MSIRGFQLQRLNYLPVNDVAPRLSPSLWFVSRRYYMSSDTQNFHIRTHTIRAQHTRERAAGAERGRENDLRHHVKQYIPKANTSPRPGDVTIIGAQANGFPKECYEPFWDDVYKRMRENGRGVRGIWIADMASQGQSGMINERILGPDQSWWDHGRDLLYLINQFQDEMPHPLIGIGHSVGASQLAHLSLLHPRLLHSLVFIDPIMQPDVELHKAFAKLSTTRRDVWPSRKAASEKFRSNRLYQQWDPRVLEKWIEFGLRDLPTEQYPDVPKDAGEVGPPSTLTTTVAQEVYFYLRGYYRDPRLLQDEDELKAIEPTLGNEPFDMPEGRDLYYQLPWIKPRVLFIFGSKSEASTPESQADKMAKTGTGRGGNGGAEKGSVTKVVLDAGHLVGMERPKEAAVAAADFMREALERWDVKQTERDAALSGLTRKDRVGINEAWKKNLGIHEESEKKRKEPKL